MKRISTERLREALRVLYLTTSGKGWARVAHSISGESDPFNIRDMWRIFGVKYLCIKIAAVAEFPGIPEKMRKVAARFKRAGVAMIPTSDGNPDSGFPWYFVRCPDADKEPLVEINPVLGVLRTKRFTPKPAKGTKGAIITISPKVLGWSPKYFQNEYRCNRQFC